jgi:hypothetical protein
MSWFNIRNRNDRWMADETADDVVFCLKSIADICQKEQQDLPTFKDYMAKIGTSILSGNYPVEDESTKQTVTDFLNLLPGNQMIIKLLPEAEEMLNETFLKIARTYMRNFDRNPFILEIIANLLFVLAESPEKYISDQTGLPEVKNKILTDNDNLKSTH